MIIKCGRCQKEFKTLEEVRKHFKKHENKNKRRKLNRLRHHLSREG
jgi:uncharacterized C2H2 Zn-finger protein